MTNMHLLSNHPSPDEYMKWMRGKFDFSLPRDFLAKENQNFWTNIPRQATAICPICNARTSEQLDLNSPIFWNALVGLGQRAASKNETLHSCEHFFFSHVFINLAGKSINISAYENRLDSFWLGPEIPHIIPLYFSVGDSFRVVMHAFPLCDIENGEFVPKFTVYIMTYFCNAQDMARAKEIAGKIDLEYDVRTKKLWPFNHIVSQKDAGEWWNLPRWVFEGRLLWMQPDSDEPVLCSYPESFPFPYANIEGVINPYFRFYDAPDSTVNVNSLAPLWAPRFKRVRYPAP
jgi:hypothetical protein